MRKLMVLLAVLALMLVLAAPAFAIVGDLGGVTYGGNCVVNDFVEICSVPLGGGGF